MTMLSVFQDEYLVSQEDYKFSRSGDYKCPVHETVSEVHDYIATLPNNDQPEIFGMHENAQIAYLKNESLKILSHVLNVQPRMGAG
jgi:dynein heavy chain, axonemal